MRTRWDCPPENTWTWSWARSARSTARRASIARLLAFGPRSAHGLRGPSSPERTTSRAVAGTPAEAVTRCGTYPMRRQGTLRRSATFAPKSLAVPAAAGTIPSMARTSVDLPEPLAPSRARDWPAGTSSDTPSRMEAPPRTTDRSQTEMGGGEEVSCIVPVDRVVGGEPAFRVEGCDAHAGAWPSRPRSLRGRPLAA